MFKDYSSLAPVLSRDDSPSLSESQAIGLVATSQANIMRVIVPSLSSRKLLISVLNNLLHLLKLNCYVS
ncbi:hypothetical protein K1719_021817 [Acacia pycnantha]|nr:hypothetical protein K1719_021817 [Acacia pycnantha]